jgi:hypothetical protein
MLPTMVVEDMARGSGGRHGYQRQGTEDFFAMVRTAFDIEHFARRERTPCNDGTENYRGIDNPAQTWGFYLTAHAFTAEDA